MSWRVEILPEALSDIEDAADWYVGQLVGLGVDFVAKVRAAINWLSDNPELPRLRHRRLGIRWIFAIRFPYRVIYRITGDRIIVLGVLHAARDDVAWRKRS